MLDPFPFAARPFLSFVGHKVGAALNLEILPRHIHEIVLSCVFYHVVCVYISPLVSARLFPNHYPRFERRTKINWDVHVVSLVQSTLINIIALWILFVDSQFPSDDFRVRVWGYTGGNGLVQALATGYFLWDMYISVRYLSIFGVGLLAHAISALWVYSLGYRPLVQYYAPIFILYELSSPFLNVHWFCDKLGLTGSNLQLYNGICLMASFFGSRLIWGVWQSWNVLYDVWTAMQYQDTPAGQVWMEATTRNITATASTVLSKDAAAQVWSATPKYIPFWLGVTYVASNVTLTGLNVFWFGKMVETIRKRFPPPFGTKKAEKAQIQMTRSLDDAGATSVEVDATEVRARKTPKRKA